MVAKNLRKPGMVIVGTLSENVISLRRARGLSQEELATRAGLYRTYVGSVEHGERDVNLSTLELLATTLHVSIIELLTKMTNNGDTVDK